MKNFFFVALLSVFVFSACRNSDDDVQQIDQILQIYIDSLGQDMLDSSLPGSYKSVNMNDVYGERDLVPVNFTLKKDADLVNYIEYVAGANRIAIDSTGESKTYESKITLRLIKENGETDTRTTIDDLRIHYLSTSRLFTIDKVWYNDSLVFTKVEGQPNVFRISK